MTFVYSVFVFILLFASLSVTAKYANAKELSIANTQSLMNGKMGRGGLWIGGGYEGTHYWIDQELGLIGLIMTQIYATPKQGRGRGDIIREAVYDALVVDGRAFR